MAGEVKSLNYIDGKWGWPKGAKEIKSVNPADTRDVICIIPDSPAEDVDRAVAAARKAFTGWRRTPAPGRADIIRRASALMTERKQKLGELVTRECGKPIGEGLGEAQEAIDMADLAAGEGFRLYGDTAPSKVPNKLCMTVREPVGVCGLITPWNFPIAIPSWKVLHGLICGNTLVLKPASDTPKCGEEFVRALVDAGLPPGVLNLVQGRGSIVGEAMSHHRGIQLLSLTGSTEMGRRIAVIGGETGKKVSLECGGKNAEIVMDDADLDLALEGALWGAFGTAGQRCTATSRLIVQAGVHDKFADMLVKGASRLKLGPGLQATTDVGPLVNEGQLKTVLEYIRIGKEEDKAELVLGGRRTTQGALQYGWFVEPTIFKGVTRTMRIFQEEIFGPVLAVTKVATLEEAIEAANDSEYGLSASIYTRDINHAMLATREIEAGLVYVNAPTIGAEVHMPFGGVKGTGNGHREAGKTGLDIFSEWKTIYIDYSDKLQRVHLG